MRIILATYPEETDGAKDATLALAEEVRRQTVGRGDIAAVYTAPEAPASDAATLLARTLSLPDPQSLPALSEGIEGDHLPALRRIQSSAWTALERFKTERGADDQILLVVPILSVHALVCRALSMPVEDYQRFRVDSGSVSIIEFRVQQNRTLLVTLNEACYPASVSA